MGDESKSGGLIQVLRRFFLVRLVVYAIVLLAVTTGIQVGAAVLKAQVLPGLTSYLLYATTALLVVLVLVVYGWLVRAFERRRASEIAIAPGAPLVIGGTLAGSLLFAAVFGVLMITGTAHYDGYRGFGMLGAPFVLAVGAGVAEELLARGVIFRVVEDGFGSIVALLVSSALFGFAHAANPGATVFSSIAIALEAGLLLGACYMAWRNLWLPIGVHIGWNFAEGGIFGAAVSGHDQAGLIATHYSGDALLTGGNFGPEASVVAIAVCVAAAAIMLAIAARRGQWRPMRRRLLLPDEQA